MIDQKKYMTPDEVHRLLKYAKQMAILKEPYYVRAYAVIHLLLATGMRGTEARLLKICDLDLGAEPEILIRNGKGGRTAYSNRK